MNTKNISLSILVLIALTSFFACEKTEKIEDFPLYPPKLVLNSHLSPDSTISIHLSKSLSILDNAELKSIDNASIKLYEDGNLLTTIENSVGDGYFTFNNKPKTGKKYRVEAENNSLGKVESETYIPVPVEIDDFKIEKNETSDWSNNYHFEVDFTDPSDSRNYYMIEVLTSSIDTFIAFNDTSYMESGPYGEYISDSRNPALDDIVYGVLYFTDEFFNGNKYKMSFDIDYLGGYSNYKSITEVRLYSLSEDAYKFRKSFGTFSETRGNPFAEPVQVYNNIEGGYGIFAGESYRKDTIHRFSDYHDYWKR